jgi:hypothetical protein
VSLHKLILTVGSADDVIHVYKITVTFIQNSAKDINDLSVEIFNFEKSSRETGGAAFGMDVSGKACFELPKKDVI